jgi:hypothetical protein
MKAWRPLLALLPKAKAWHRPAILLPLVSVRWPRLHRHDLVEINPVSVECERAFPRR